MNEPETEHTCHKTDSNAVGFVDGYHGDKMACAGFAQMRQGGCDGAYSLIELQRAYSAIRRKWKRFETHKRYHAKRLGAHSAYDAMLNYETDGAFCMGFTHWPQFNKAIGLA